MERKTLKLTGRQKNILINGFLGLCLGLYFELRKEEYTAISVIVMALWNTFIYAYLRIPNFFYDKALPKHNNIPVLGFDQLKHVCSCFGIEYLSASIMTAKAPLRIFIGNIELYDWKKWINLYRLKRYLKKHNRVSNTPRNFIIMFRTTSAGTTKWWEQQDKWGQTYGRQYAGYCIAFLIGIISYLLLDGEGLTKLTLCLGVPIFATAIFYNVKVSTNPYDDMD